MVPGYVNFKWYDEEILINTIQFLMLLNFLFTAARLFYDLMPSRNCNKAQKFGMGFLGGKFLVQGFLWVLLKALGML